MPICIGRERSVHNCIRHRTTLRGLEKKKLSIQHASALISQRIVDPEKEILIRTLGGNRRDIFFKVVLPGSVPTLLSATKVNIGLSLVGVIIGEFLAAKQGLGYLIIYGSQVFQLDMVISSILLLCVIAMLLYLLTQSLEHYSKKHRN